MNTLSPTSGGLSDERKKWGIQTRVIDFYYQAGSWDKPRRVIRRIDWHERELLAGSGSS